MDASQVIPQLTPSAFQSLVRRTGSLFAARSKNEPLRRGTFPFIFFELNSIQQAVLVSISRGCCAGGPSGSTQFRIDV